MPMNWSGQTGTTRARWVLMAALLAVLLFGPGLVRQARLAVHQFQLDQQLAALGAERMRLLTEQERLESDPAYVEGLIRTTFKFARPGESVLAIDA
jgi:cell division protein FtsB